MSKKDKKEKRDKKNKVTMTVNDTAQDSSQELVQESIQDQDFSPELCNHDLNDPLNSLKVFPKKNLVYPDSTFCACENCHQSFEFQKDDRGAFVLVNST